MQDVSTILPNGTVVQNRYIIEGLLGKGGFGAVYLVRDQRVRANLYALKEVVAPGKTELDRFIFEGEVLKRLDHPALPRVYRTFENDHQTRAYILMDYIEGPNLEFLRKQQPDRRFSLSQVFAMLTPIANALTYLHHQQPPIVHRDVKPSNIIVSPLLNESVLVDFGVAKEQDPEGTTTMIRRASPGYAAPEQYSRGTSTRTDVYGLAATVYTLLTGTIPADALTRMTEIGSQGMDALVPAHQLNPAISPQVAEVIQRAMAINSNERYASVEEFWSALKAAQEASPTDDVGPISLFPLESPLTSGAGLQEGRSATKPTVQVMKLPRARRKRGLLALLLLLLVLLLIAGGVLYSNFTAGQRSQAPVVSSPVVGHTPVTTPTLAPTATPTSQPSPTATPSPTTAPASYPVLVSSYGGTIHNTLANISSTMMLTSVRQNGGAFSGYLTLGSALQGSGPFNGSVATNGSIHFLVQALGNHLPLYFYGTVNKNGSMSGSYCSWQNNQCNYAGGGYGTWIASPTSALTPASSSSASIDRRMIAAEEHVSRMSV